MQLTEQGQQQVNEIASRHGFSFDAVLHLLLALQQGYGTQAQFNHFELGGSGQWMSGGMIMIGDMFNNQLKGRIDSLCYELSNLMQQTNLFWSPPEQNYQQAQSSGFSFSSTNFSSNTSWWPSELGLGFPAASGSQNQMRYAYFPDSQRLALDISGQVTVYDTGGHQIGGFSQQQSGDYSVTFTSQYGLVSTQNLQVVYPQQNTPTNEPPLSQPATPTDTSQTNQQALSSQDVFDMLEKLGQLKERGILTEEEFANKKAELLNKL